MAKPRLHLDADASYRILKRVLLERGQDLTRTACEWMLLDVSGHAVAAAMWGVGLSIPLIYLKEL